MATFVYTARKLDGTRITGSLPAENERAALTALDRMGLFPVELTDENTAQKRAKAKESIVGDAIRKQLEVVRDCSIARAASICLSILRASS